MLRFFYIPPEDPQMTVGSWQVARLPYTRSEDPEPLKILTFFSIRIFDCKQNKFEAQIVYRMKSPTLYARVPLSEFIHFAVLLMVNM